MAYALGPEIAVTDLDLYQNEYSQFSSKTLDFFFKFFLDFLNSFVCKEGFRV